MLCLYLQTRPAPRLQALTVEKEHDDEFGMGESDDEIGDEEDAKRNFFSIFPASIIRIRDDVKGGYRASYSSILVGATTRLLNSNSYENDKSRKYKKLQSDVQGSQNTWKVMRCFFQSSS